MFSVLMVSCICSGAVINVDGRAAGNNDGSNWIDAYADLQSAIGGALAGDEIHVAQGVYTPAAAFGSRSATFGLLNGVVIQGGYAGIGAPDPNMRDIDAYETILSGDLNGNDGADFANNSDNSYHVVTGSGTDYTAVLDGFTITAGNANVLDLDARGGGMLNYLATPVVINCTFKKNYALTMGGGMFNLESSPVITNCTFIENVSDDDGGGIRNYIRSDAIITNCRFIRNYCFEDGGGIGNRKDSNAFINNCTFIGNYAGAGGGMENHVGQIQTTDVPIITNCTFIGNISNEGAGMRNNDANPIVRNCIFVGNIGSGMNNRTNTPTITNCIFWANTEDSLDGNGEPVVTFCDVQGGFAGTGNIDADPLFVDPDGPDNIIGTEDDNMHLLPDSPCIDAGDPGYVPEPNEADFDGQPRVINGRIDMGVDESAVAEETLDPGQEMIINPTGGGSDPNEEALVVFENVSGDPGATIEVSEVISTLHPEGLFQALGKTLRVETSLPDGEFFMTISIPFDSSDLGGEDPFKVDLLYWDDAAGKWRHAVKSNTDPQQSNSRKNRWQEEYPPTAGPTLGELKARGLGANGVFWNSDSQAGFVWANVDHTSDFEGMIHAIADFEPDGIVGLADLSAFALAWLNTCNIGQPGCDGADFTSDGNVDLQDFGILSDQFGGN